MKKVYISLPVTAENVIDQRNHAFVVGTNLAQKGYDVVTPFDVIKSNKITQNTALGERIEALLQCQVIYLCRGWQASRTCRSELQVALAHDLELITE